ncbi:unnamed protein product [Eruca vesicaria subsp. sativa]|uniref:Uncharacterized protein n=1 Tax=Eruca vesicaria subsp. sativa TaxID=29727 RepID=A0ABC8JBS7_ERUVS|nr:unnamed protein product [Eruca vesicaria subsp. sativa]
MSSSFLKTCLMFGLRESEGEQQDIATSKYLRTHSSLTSPLLLRISGRYRSDNLCSITPFLMKSELCIPQMQKHQECLVLSLGLRGDVNRNQRLEARNSRSEERSWISDCRGLLVYASYCEDNQELRLFQ